MEFEWNCCIDIYVLYSSQRKKPRHEKIFYITSSCTLFIYYIEEIAASKDNIYHYFFIKKTISLREYLFNLCLMFDLLDFIHECCFG